MSFFFKHSRSTIEKILIRVLIIIILRKMWRINLPSINLNLTVAFQFFGYKRLWTFRPWLLNFKLQPVSDERSLRVVELMTHSKKNFINFWATCESTKFTFTSLSIWTFLENFNSDWWWTNTLLIKLLAEKKWYISANFLLRKN